jgi:hypothetical protein
MGDYFNLSAARMIWAMQVCDDPFRSYLFGALVEPLDEGALIVATNGKIMLVQHDRQAIAPRRAVLRLTPPAPPPPDERDACDDCGAALPAFEWDGGRVHIPADIGPDAIAANVKWCGDPSDVYMIAQQTAPADQYPDWREAWRTPYDTTETGTGGIDRRLLDQLCGDHHYIRVTGNRPWQVSFRHDAHALGVIMPIKVDADSVERIASMTARAGLSPKGGA